MNQLMATMLATSLLILGSVSAVHAEDANQANPAMQSAVKAKHHASKRHHNRHHVAHAKKHRSGHAVTTASSRKGHRQQANSMQAPQMKVADAQSQNQAVQSNPEKANQSDKKIF